MRKTLRFNLRLFSLCVFLAAALSAQQADRAIITGLVVDASGAAIPGAVVTVTNEGTHVDTVIRASSEGNYSTPQLILGTYSVKAEKAGFAIVVETGIVLQGGANYRRDLTLRAGDVSEIVEVKADAVLVNASNAEISNVINERYYQDIPIIASQDMRLPEALQYAQPGFVPVKLSSFPSGTGFFSRMNGGQAGAVESYLDGAAFGQGGNTNLTFESSPPVEAISEMKVEQSSFSAQTGLTSGGLVSYTTKSGTSQLHGSFYEYVNTDAFNARGETSPRSAALHVNNYGFTVGGPVYLPKIYDGRKKTFFFFDMDFTHKTAGNLPNFGLTTPTDPFKAGDFSSILSASAPIAQDALGRPIYAGEIFNPGTSRTINGVAVRDGYGFDPATGLPTSTANMIPANDPQRSAIAAKYTKLIPEPQRAGTIFNYQTPANDSYIRDKTVIARVDHNFTDSLKETTTVNWDTRPRVTNCAFLGACTTYPAPSNNTYIGNGYYQRIRDTIVHEQVDWVIRPNIFNHLTVAYESMDHPNIALASQQNWLAYFGITGLYQDNGGAPQISFTGSVPFSQLGEAQHTANDRPHWDQVLDDVTWIHGRHSIKMGIDFRHLVFTRISQNNQSGIWNFNDRETGGYDRSGNLLSSTGNSFASFLLGQVDNTNFTINQKVSFRHNYIAPWLSDEYKITPRLTLTAGLRWDRQSAMTEKNNGLSTFSPTAANPAANGIPGAMIFAGSGAGRSGMSSFQSPKYDSFGPRFAFAYQVPGNVLSVIRGGYGIYYASVNMNQFAASPDIGVNTNPTAPNLTNGFAPALYWDNGFPAANVVVGPVLNPSVANGTSPIALSGNSFDLPRYQNWTLTLERQVANNILLDISYLANHGTRLTNSGASLGIADNMNNPSVRSLGAALLNSNINSPQAQAAGIKKPYPTFAGNVAQAIRPFPQFQNINFWAVPTGSSTYSALEIKAAHRFSQGLQAQAAYTFSKLLVDDAENGMSHQDGGPQNPLDPHAERAVSTDNVPHLFILSYSYELPFGRGKAFLGNNALLDKFVGGWRISGLQRYEHGRPLGIFMNNDLGGILFNSTKRPNKVGLGTDHTGRGMNPATQLFLKSSGWADPGALQFGNASRNDPKIYGFGNYSEDLNLIKDTRFEHNMDLRIELQGSNALNRHTWCDPNTNWSSAQFGQVSGQCNTPRRVQLGAKFQY